MLFNNTEYGNNMSIKFAQTRWHNKPGHDPRTQPYIFSTQCQGSISCCVKTTELLIILWHSFKDFRFLQWCH